MKFLMAVLITAAVVHFVVAFKMLDEHPRSFGMFVIFLLQICLAAFFLHGAIHIFFEILKTNCGG